MTTYDFFNLIILSIDSIKKPFIAYMQGSITYEYGKLGIMIAVDNMLKENI